MSLGQVQKEARADCGGMTQQVFARQVNLSRSMIAEIERGAKKMPRDVAPHAVHTLDSGYYAMEMASELTGGAWAGKLNGDSVDLHRSSVLEKTKEELREALQSIQSVRLVNAPAAMGPDERVELRKAILQVIDAIVAANHLVAQICKEYRFSWVQLWKEWRKKAKRLGYMK